MTYAWNFGYSTTGTGVSPSHSYATAGIYNVCLTVNDSYADLASACTLSGRSSMTRQEDLSPAAAGSGRHCEHMQLMPRWRAKLPSALSPSIRKVPICPPAPPSSSSRSLD